VGAPGAGISGPRPTRRRARLPTPTDVLERADDSRGVFTPLGGPGPVERRGPRPPPRRPRPGTRGAGSSRSAPFDSAPTRFAPSFPRLVTRIGGVFGSETREGTSKALAGRRSPPPSTALRPKRAISSARRMTFPNSYCFMLASVFFISVSVSLRLKNSTLW